MQESSTASDLLKEIPDSRLPDYVGTLFRGSSWKLYILLPAFDKKYCFMNSEGKLIVHIDNFMGADQWVRVNSGWPDLTPKVIKEFFPYLRYIPEGEVRFSPKIARHTFHARLKKLAFPILRDKPFSAPNFVADLRRDFDRNTSSFHLVYQGTSIESARRHAILYSLHRRSLNLENTPAYENFGMFDPIKKELLCGPVSPEYLARNFSSWRITEEVIMQFFP